MINGESMHDLRNRNMPGVPFNFMHSTASRYPTLVVTNATPRIKLSDHDVDVFACNLIERIAARNV